MATFRKAYDKHQRFPTEFSGETKTKQSFARECDINHLMAKYQKTGLIDHVNKHQGNYSDLTDVPNYHDALNKVISAQNSFDSLPSSLRNKFENDPALFLDFVSDESNKNEMIELGLIPNSVTPVEPSQPPVENDPPASAEGEPSS